MTELFKRLDSAKGKMNKGNPIRMDLFLSFLTVNTEAVEHHVGASTGRTMRTGEEDLVIEGCFVDGVEYLDGIEYGEKMHNCYNNFVNPFFLFNIMTEQGKKFFIDYYSDDIKEEVKAAEDQISALKARMGSLEKYKSGVEEFFGSH